MAGPARADPTAHQLGRGARQGRTAHLRFHRSTSSHGQRRQRGHLPTRV